MVTLMGLKPVPLANWRPPSAWARQLLRSDTSARTVTRLLLPDRRHFAPPLDAAGQRPLGRVFHFNRGGYCSVQEQVSVLPASWPEAEPPPASFPRGVWAWAAWQELVPCTAFCGESHDRHKCSGQSHRRQDAAQPA